MTIAQSSGTIAGTSSACGEARIFKVITYKFRRGSLLYSLPKAKVGILEMICIKEILLNSNASSFGRIIPMYIDTFNGHWNEYDLCLGEEAKARAIAFLEARRDEYLKYISSCNTSLL